MAPSTTLYLFQNIPWDNSYKNVVAFSSRSAQQSYFAGLTKKSYSNLSYQRTNESINIGEPADELMKYNYLAFYNGDDYEGEWIYAFITNVNYINDGNTEILFEVDVMQTYLLDVTFLPSYVLRQHSENDSVGNNIEPEPEIELGDYDYTYLNRGSQTSGVKYIALCAWRADGTPPLQVYWEGGGLWGGVYNGIGLVEGDSVKEVQGYVESMQNTLHTDDVVALFQIPLSYYQAKGSTAPVNITINIPKPTMSTVNFDGYEPKNAKMLTSPYMDLLVTNQMGDEEIYGFEHFYSGSQATFEIYSVLSYPLEIVAIPQQYEKLEENYLHFVKQSNFPMLPYTTDSYRAFIAQMASNIISVAGSVASFVNPAVGSAIAFGGSLLGQFSPQRGGAKNTNSGLTMLGLNQIDIFFYRRSIQNTFAQRADRYFTMYGYAQNTVMTPNIHARPHWTYLQTRDINIQLSAPAEYVQQIREICDAGTTFWENPGEIGNYNLDNSPA